MENQPPSPGGNSAQNYAYYKQLYKAQKKAAKEIKKASISKAKEQYELQIKEAKERKEAAEEYVKEAVRNAKTTTTTTATAASAPTATVIATPLPIATPTPVVQQAAQTAQTIQTNPNKKAKVKMTSPCDTCEKEHIPLFQLQAGTQLKCFCSMKCYWKYGKKTGSMHN